MPNDPDVQADDIFLLRGRADGEGMPLKGGDGRNVDEDVIAGLEGEMRWPFDNQAYDSAWQDYACGHPGLAC